jgi:hypothetical protein
MRFTDASSVTQTRIGNPARAEAIILRSLNLRRAHPYPLHCSTTGRRWSNVSLLYAANGKPDECDPRSRGCPALRIKPSVADNGKAAPRGAAFCFPPLVHKWRFVRVAPGRSLKTDRLQSDA